MRSFVLALAVAAAPALVFAQQDARTLERFTLALEQPRLAVPVADRADALRATERQILGSAVFEPLAGAPAIGPLTFAAPQLRGEFVRLALPVGEYVSTGLRALAAAHQRRQAKAARRRVASELDALTRAKAR